ncbi:hypothetical protein HCH54_009986 [Aspergillus fumigatus]
MIVIGGARMERTLGVDVDKQRSHLGHMSDVCEVAGCPCPTGPRTKDQHVPNSAIIQAGWPVLTNQSPNNNCCLSRLDGDRGGTFQLAIIMKMFVRTKAVSLIDKPSSQIFLRSQANNRTI